MPLKEPRVRARGLDTGPTRAVGVLVLVLALVIVAVGVLKPRPFNGDRTVHVDVADASGIGVVGEEVRMAGTPVGRIAGVDRVGDHARLTLKLGKEAGALHRDATAELRPHLAFEGTAYLDLHPGSPGAGDLGDATIPLSRTRVYVPLDTALRAFDPSTRAATRATVRELRDVLARGGGAGLQATLRRTPALTRALGPAALAAQGPHGTELTGALRGLARTTDAVARRRADLVPLTRSAARTFAAFDADQGAALDGTLAALPPALAALDRGGVSLEGIVDRLDPLARELRPGLAALRPSLDTARPLVRSLGPALTRATPLVADLRGAIRSGAAARPATARLLDALDPSTTLLDASLLPALHAPTKKLGLPAYLSFLNMFAGGGGASRPFQTGSEPGAMGAGHFMRFGFRFITGMGAPTPPCSLLAKANPQLAQAFSDAGGCTP